MHQVQLVDYAQHSQKLEGRSLTESPAVRTTSVLKVLLAHGTDFGCTYFSATFFATLFNQSFKSVLVTSGLRHSFSGQYTLSLVALLLPLFVFGYFFFSYFFNHGQTFGMNLFKLRVQLRENNFSDSFKWALNSLGLCFSGGMTAFLFKDLWASFRNHDYLYEELMSHKDATQISLLKRIDENEAKKLEEVIWKVAS